MFPFSKRLQTITIEGLAKSFNLEKSISLHYLDQYGKRYISLYPIVEKENLDKEIMDLLPLPFLVELFKLVERLKKAWEKNQGMNTFEFRIRKPTTVEQIKEKMEATSFCFNMMWAAYE